MKIGLFLLCLSVAPRAFAGMAWSTPQCHSHQQYLQWLHEREELNPEQSFELDAVKAFICAPVPKGDDFERRCVEFWRQRYDEECSPNE